MNIEIYSLKYIKANKLRTGYFRLQTYFQTSTGMLNDSLLNIMDDSRTWLKELTSVKIYSREKFGGNQFIE